MLTGSHRSATTVVPFVHRSRGVDLDLYCGLLHVLVELHGARGLDTTRKPLLKLLLQLAYLELLELGKLTLDVLVSLLLVELDDLLLHLLHIDVLLGVALGFECFFLDLLFEISLPLGLPFSTFLHDE